MKSLGSVQRPPVTGSSPGKTAQPCIAHAKTHAAKVIQKSSRQFLSRHASQPLMSEPTQSTRRLECAQETPVHKTTHTAQKASTLVNIRERPSKKTANKKELDIKTSDVGGSVQRKTPRSALPKSYSNPVEQVRYCVDKVLTPLLGKLDVNNPGPISIFKREDPRSALLLDNKKLSPVECEFVYRGDCLTADQLRYAQKYGLKPRVYVTEIDNLEDLKQNINFNVNGHVDAEEDTIFLSTSKSRSVAPYYSAGLRLDNDRYKNHHTVVWKIRVGNQNKFIDLEKTARDSNLPEKKSGYDVGEEEVLHIGTISPDQLVGFWSKYILDNEDDVEVDEGSWVPLMDSPPPSGGL